ncbi:DUF1107 family protein [Ferrimonas marina]|uniref:DUF1107 family protein n=1 Tax=Ferrimonas marina TaxID=299255 RepID=UPI00082EC752|nr:DUF1107 family protein [Ferrimonas marina]
MRIFPLYAPRLIAKHARIFRDGVVVVKNLGRLEFRDGRFVMPRHCRPKLREVVVELNRMVKPAPVAT